MSLLTLAACNTDDDGDVNLFGPFDFTGVFVVQEANGSRLPAVVVDSGNPRVRIELLSGRITLRADRTFEDVTEFRQTINGVVTSQTQVCRGNYTESSLTLKITFAEDGGGRCTARFVGRLSGDILRVTIRDVGLVLIRD